MCFYNDDCEWVAQVQEETSKPATKPIKCNECGAIIPVGSVVHHVFMQEHEECNACYSGECSCPLDVFEVPSCSEGNCQCAKPAFGETFAYDRCDECERFLRIIQEVEIEDGCPPYESRPMLCDMIESLQQADSKRYFRRAIKDDRSLQKSGYLGRIGKLVFSNG